MVHKWTPAHFGMALDLIGKDGRMKKYLWGIMVGVCFIVLLIVGDAVLIPRLLHSAPATVVTKGHEILVPGHWWKAEMTEQQLGTLSAYWGRSMSAAQLLQALWPEALQQMPEEARGVYEHQGLNWPPEGFEDWESPSFMCAGSGVAHDDGQTLYFYYLGCREDEEMTLVMNADRGFTEDRIYRVSLYIDE